MVHQPYPFRGDCSQTHAGSHGAGGGVKPIDSSDLHFSDSKSIDSSDLHFSDSKSIDF